MTTIDFDKATERQLVAHFNKKFKAIPGPRWIVGDLVDERGRCCALGHCGMRWNGLANPEADALSALLGGSGRVSDINNGTRDNVTIEVDPRAKTRILAALAKLEAKP